MTTPPVVQSNLAFLPWVRSGAAAAIDAPETLGSGQMGVANINVTLSVNGAAQATPVAVRLRGPADVIGIDAHQIIRMDPPPGTTDFESSSFVCIEFDRADYPWLFTPAAANAQGKLRPWLCLVLVQKQDGVTLGTTPDAPLPVLQIAAPATPASELPNLADSWAWAHAQAAPDSATSTLNPDDVTAAIDDFPERSLSRLVCPRMLAANTDYIACVVPTFDLSCKTGLGTATPDAELGKASLTPAWTLAPAPATVRIPVYHHWDFRTGPAGSFASLVSQLRARPTPPELGRRTIDISQPGFTPNAGFPTSVQIEMEGALRPILAPSVPDVMPPWPDGALSPFESKLAEILNTPSVIAATTPDADPVLGPTLYGRWHVKDATVASSGERWYDQVNLDPRLRVVAAFGTRVVQQNQEALMASAWEQAGEIQRANQRLRQLQMSMTIGDRLVARHFSRLTQEHSTRVGAPLFGQIAPIAGTPGAPTIEGQMASANVPTQAVSPAMRRIGRLRGPLTRRIGTQGVVRANTSTWVAALLAGTASLPPLPATNVATISGVDARMAPVGTVQPFTAITADVVAARGTMPFFVINAEGQPVQVALSQVVTTPPFDSFSAQVFRRAAHDHLARVKPERGAVPIVPPPVTGMSDIQGALVVATAPSTTVSDVAHVVVRHNSGGGTILPFAATAGGSDGTASVAPIILPPTFPHAMSQSLRDLSQDLLLPGVETIPADTVLGLETNRRFVEAFMLGLNVEMGRELLWRGYPTDQRGTYFASFWSSSREDITDLNTWGTRSLGDPALAPDTSERFVMLVRSALLRRYPDALIYLTRAVPVGAGRGPSDAVADERQPIFLCSMQPDVAFFGFDVTPAEAVGTGGATGYYVVIQEHPTAPRFGLQNGATIPVGATHVPIGSGPPSGQSTLGLTWGLNSATTAAIVRHRPARLAIHASQLLGGGI